MLNIIINFAKKRLMILLLIFIFSFLLININFSPSSIKSYTGLLSATLTVSSISIAFLFT